MEAKKPRKDAAGAGGHVGTARPTRIGVLVHARVGHRTGVEVETAACTYHRFSLLGISPRPRLSRWEEL